MKKTVLTFGIIAGTIEVAMLLITIPINKSGNLNLDHGELIGYTTMVIALSMIFFGVKSYRDKQLNGVISFGNAFKVGALIAGVASLMYVIGWELDLHFFVPDFMDQYASAIIKKAQENHDTAEQIKITTAKMEDMKDLYKNVFARVAMTLLEILPVGLLIAVISAAVLRKKEVLPA